MNGKELLALQLCQLMCKNLGWLFADNWVRQVCSMSSLAADVNPHTVLRELLAKSPLNEPLSGRQGKEANQGKECNQGKEQTI